MADGRTAWSPYFSGDWDEALGLLDELIAIFVDDPFWMEGPCRWLRGRMRLARGDLRGAQEDAERGLELARVTKDPQVLWPALAGAARVFLPTDPAARRCSASTSFSRSGSEAIVGVSGSDSEWTIDLAAVLVP